MTLLSSMRSLSQKCSAEMDKTRHRARTGCMGRVLWIINNQPLCNHHYEVYCESNYLDAETVVRLSDEESDFVPALRKKIRMNNGQQSVSI